MSCPLSWTGAAHDCPGHGLPRTTAPPLGTTQMFNTFLPIERGLLPCVLGPGCGCGEGWGWEVAGWVSHIPDCGVKLKGEDDVVVLADLADEAALGAQVAVVDVLEGKFYQGFEESFIHPVCNLRRASRNPSYTLSVICEGLVN